MWPTGSAGCARSSPVPPEGSRSSRARNNSRPALRKLSVSAAFRISRRDFLPAYKKGISRSCKCRPAWCSAARPTLCRTRTMPAPTRPSKVKQIAASMREFGRHSKRSSAKGIDRRKVILWLCAPISGFRHQPSRRCSRCCSSSPLSRARVAGYRGSGTPYGLSPRVSMVAGTRSKRSPLQCRTRSSKTHDREIPFLLAGKKSRREIRKAAETLSFRSAVG